jgi:hypothetical protein
LISVWSAAYAFSGFRQFLFSFQQRKD